MIDIWEMVVFHDLPYNFYFLVPFVFIQQKENSNGDICSIKELNYLLKKRYTFLKTDTNFV